MDKFWFITLSVTSGVLLNWLLFKLIRKGWRVLVVLFIAAFISGCASTSNKFDKSPCACDFQPLNSIQHVGKGHA